MTTAEIKDAISTQGYLILAQTCHSEGMVSYDAMKGTGRWPHGRKLAKGEPRQTPHAALRALLQACVERDLPKFTRRVTES